ncbi:MAG: ribosomal-protein-alanine N-acetyltransferase [Rhodospirillaceae bacterium]|nr:MAG: ribosomal-protein-alanine N-acetyltransferase [Rhodospirillaceae bacterium]
MIRNLSVDEIDSIYAIEEVSNPSPWSRDSFLSEFSHESGIRLGYTLDILVGFCFGRLIVDEFTILNIAVTKEHRNRGIGKELMLTAMKHAQEKGAIKSFLEVRTGNAAAFCLYQSLGFKEVSKRKNYYSQIGQDAINMEMIL